LLLLKVEVRKLDKLDKLVKYRVEYESLLPVSKVSKRIIV